MSKMQNYNMSQYTHKYIKKTSLSISQPMSPSLLKLSRVEYG